MLVLAPPLAPVAWTSEWRILAQGKAIGSARETWRLAADGSGTTRFVQTLTGAGGNRIADRQATLGPGGIPLRESLTLNAGGQTARYSADLGPKVAAMRLTMPGFRASYEIDAPTGIGRGLLTPATVERLAKAGGTTNVTLFEPQKTRWTRLKVTVGKRLGKDQMFSIQDDQGLRADYAFDAAFRPRVIQYSTGFRFERVSVKEG